MSPEDRFTVKRLAREAIVAQGVQYEIAIVVGLWLDAASRLKHIFRDRPDVDLNRHLMNILWASKAHVLAYGRTFFDFNQTYTTALKQCEEISDPASRD